MPDARALLVHPQDGVTRISSALDDAGIDVTTVNTATAAVAKAATGTYDCVVSEYVLPGDDGVTLAEAMEDADVSVPVILFTETTEAAADAAGSHTISKLLKKNGAASIDRLVTDVSSVCFGKTAANAGQDISGHEPDDSDIARAVQEAPVGISISDSELEDYPLVYVNDAWETHSGYPAEEALGRNPRFLQGPGTDQTTIEQLSAAIENEEQTTVEIRNYRRDGTPFWNELTVAPVYDDDGLTHYVGFQNDVSDRKRAEQLAEERAEKLATERQVLDRVLGRVNGLLSEVSRILVEERSAEVIAERVCEEVADEPGYKGGWIGEVSSATGELEITAASGVSVTADASFPLEETPDEVQSAVETSEAQGCHAGNTTDGALAPAEIGGTRLLVVPITYGERRYGLLGIYSNEGNALDHREQKVCESVGKMIANGLHSVETTRILTTDRVVELSVAIADPSFTLSQIAEALDSTVEHLGTTRLDEEACELYLRTDTPSAAFESVEALEFVESVRVVSETDSEVTFTVTATESPPLTRLAEYGSVVVEATAEPSSAELVIEAPPEQDVRSMLDVFRAEYAGVTLRSRIEQESPDRGLTEFASAVDDRLTDRQRSALKTAELNGYFEWPRPVDGSEIAEQMGITRQTFHQHLRAAERKLVEAYVNPRSRN